MQISVLPIIMNKFGALSSLKKLLKSTGLVHIVINKCLR